LTDADNARIIRITEIIEQITSGILESEIIPVDDGPIGRLEQSGRTHVFTP